MCPCSHHLSTRGVNSDSNIKCSYHNVYTIQRPVKRVTVMLMLSTNNVITEVCSWWYQLVEILQRIYTQHDLICDLLSTGGRYMPWEWMMDGLGWLWLLISYKERMRKNLCTSSVTKNNNVTDINYYILYIYKVSWKIKCGNSVSNELISLHQKTEILSLAGASQIGVGSHIIIMHEENNLQFYWLISWKAAWWELHRLTNL